MFLTVSLTSATDSGLGTEALVRIAVFAAFDRGAGAAGFRIARHIRRHPQGFKGDEGLAGGMNPRS